MFPPPPPPPGSDDFNNFFYPHQEDLIPQDLILGGAQASSLEEVSNITNKNKNNVCEKKILRKEIERQRRQHMSNLSASLRSLLPLEYIKGKRSVCDHIHGAENYIAHLKKNIEDLSVKRDKLKNLPDSEALDHGNASSENCTRNCVSVRSYCGGVEILIGGGLREESLNLSRVIELVTEEGLDVVRSFSTQTDEGLFHIIQSEVSDPVHVDLNGLQQKLNYIILSDDI